MRNFYLLFSSFFTCIATCNFVFAQTAVDTVPGYQKIIPGPEYKASGFKRWLWGNNYRDVWTTPVTLPLFYPDSSRQGHVTLTPGIINQNLNLHIQNGANKDYLIRPVNKTLGKNLPVLFRKTFIEQRLTDGGSASNPYGGAPVPVLARAAGVYSAGISYGYAPSPPKFGDYDTLFGDKFFVFEEIAPGNAESYITTAALLDTLNNNTGIRIDNKALVKARLFDMFLNDWNRPGQNWLWGKKITGGKTVYVPLPVNRDQALSNYDGLLFGAGIAAGDLNYFQKFKNNIPNVIFFNQRERNFDRRLLNQAGLQEWQDAAKDLQQSLTDKIIQEAVKQFPPEVYAQTGNTITAVLRERRRHIAEWANEYYHFISKKVQVTGSAGNDRFEVHRINNKEVSLQVFGANDNTPFYSRTFEYAETKEIRLFGLSGNDTYRISGNGKSRIGIKISDGINNDSVIDLSSLRKKNKRIIVYAKDGVKTNNASSIHINHDTTNRTYHYDWFRYNRKGLSPFLFYSLEDRLHAGFSYRILRNKWDRRPFASLQRLSLHYSIMEGAPSLTYKGLFPRLVLGSHLTLLANYDFIRWQFYFGPGNNTSFDKNETLKYYTARTRQWILKPQLTKVIGNSTINVYGSLQGIKVIDDSSRFIMKPGMNTTGYNWQTYTGAGISYSFQYLNDAIVPTKGFYIDASAAGEQNINNPASHYMKYAGNAYFYIPLTSKFSFNIRAGASTVTGNPGFYQMASIGGTIFRGSAMDRFRGKTAFYNTNDLRFIAPFHSWFFNGKAGVFAFCDNGRVWLPGEQSNAWHVAYGGGLIISPFNLLYLDASLGFYKNEFSVQVRTTFPLPM
ncbi:hypothetical protein [Parafilimonas sp.]|uniref:hypothetical protein n=1 Tax=Parafilimonas sp. TaxID=1969739 RepID=UPI0039E4C0C2